MADVYQKEYQLKYVKGVSCVTQLSCVKPVTNVKLTASNLPVGARHQNYWQIWQNLGASPKVVQILATPSLTDLAKLDTVTDSHKQLCKPSQDQLKYVKGVSCVTQLSCVKPVTNVKLAASNLPVGARLQNYWQIWQNLGASPKVVQILATPSPFGSGQT